MSEDSKEYQRKYYVTNVERLKTYQRKYYVEHRGEMIKKNKIWYKNNRGLNVENNIKLFKSLVIFDKYVTFLAANFLINLVARIERLNKYKKEYYRNNKKTVNKKHRVWYRKNRETELVKGKIRNLTKVVKRNERILERLDSLPSLEELRKLRTQKKRDWNNNWQRKNRVK